MQKGAIAALAIMLAGCSLTFDGVTLRKKMCVEAGGVPTVLVTTDKRPMSVICTIDGIVYRATALGLR